MNSIADNSPLNVLAPVPQWATAGDVDSAVILATRVRIARNLAEEKFPHKLDTEGRIRVLRLVGRAINDSQPDEDGVFFSLASLTPPELALLAERRAISVRMVSDESPRGVYYWKQRDRMIQICTDDHIRAVEILPGLRPETAFEALAPVVNELATYLRFAWSPRLGFLTTRPYDLGDGVHASLIAHLPALVMTRGIEPLIQELAASGFYVTTPNGNGSEAFANLFDLSNGPGLARTVGDSLNRLRQLGEQVQEREALARIDMQSQRPEQIRDRVARSVAILQAARVLSTREAMALLSGARLGIDLGWIEGLDRQTISLLSFELSRPYLDYTAPPKTAVDDRQRRRATKAREVFASARYVG
jgi:protein arginine kinase